MIKTRLKNRVAVSAIEKGPKRMQTKDKSLFGEKRTIDLNWFEKITIAKEARQCGREMRKGKPVVFQTYTRPYG